MQFYLNGVYFGEGAYGIESASNTFQNKNTCISDSQVFFVSRLFVAGRLDDRRIESDDIEDTDEVIGEVAPMGSQHLIQRCP